MRDILGTENNFKSLSLKDLLAGRDLYHFHLMNKANVVGTAVGLYLIRNSDPYPSRPEFRRVKIVQRTGDRSPRTFTNSSVREYSWPCVLVMVRDWKKESEFSGAPLHPEQMVPKTLYLPDGRMVPVCVVLVEQAEKVDGLLPQWHWPDNLFGGGMPIIVETQNRQRNATAGCLVTDGHTIYALTSRHVCGAEGEPVYTLAAGKKLRIGGASRQHLTRLEFERIYPEFPARRTFVNLDVGLIELSDANRWTSQVFGLGETGPLADLNELNMTLRLIEAPLVASGAASGRLEGRIKALFYRYKSVGGYDYVSDFLIAPRILTEEEQERGNEISDDERRQRLRRQQTQPGDSGTIWHLVTQPPSESSESANLVAKPADEFVGTLRPLCVQWGGQVFADSSTARPDQYAFALATSLTTVCHQLNVELVIEHNTGVQPYWGQMGHHDTAAFAIDALTDATLKTFMTDNAENVSFSIPNLTPKQIATLIKEARNNDTIIPLADVPDLVWKKFHTEEGGRDTISTGAGRTNGPEHPTHYADIDEQRPIDQQTLMQLSLVDPANISVAFWQQFYDDTGHNNFGERGLLPFRVWQFYDAMKDAVANQDGDAFVCAAGLLSHYVGDACQPLHGSKFADGFKDQPTTELHHHQDGTPFTVQSHKGAGVHSMFETDMIDRKAAELVAGIPTAVAAGGALPVINSGHDAAVEIINLMSRTAASMDPETLVDDFLDIGDGKTTVAVQDAMWLKYKQRVIDAMADGALVLAAIWQAAWTNGNGNAIPAGQLGTRNGDDLRNRYNQSTFVESFDLDHIGPHLV